MAKSLKTILGNDKKLEGVKSSSKEKLDLGGYTPKAGDEKKFVTKHEIEKFADRVGNDDKAYKASNKQADYPKQDEKVYESALSDSEGIQSYGPAGSTPASHADEKKFKKKKVNEATLDRVYDVLEHIAANETVFKFKNGEKAIIDAESAFTMWEIYDALTEENKAKFVEVAFNSPEAFYDIVGLRGE